jgi:hypothetical protein
VLITSPSEFIDTFGTPHPDYQGTYAALLYLQQGRQLYYGRAASTDAWAHTPTYNSSTGDPGLTINRTYYLYAGKIVHHGVTYDYNEDGNVGVKSFKAVENSYSVVGGTCILIPQVANKAQVSLESGKLVIYALSEGDWGNNIGVTVEDAGYSAGSYKVTVYERSGTDNVSREVYNNVNTNINDDNFIEKVINGTSQYITVYSSGSSLNLEAADSTGALKLYYETVSSVQYPVVLWLGPGYTDDSTHASPRGRANPESLHVLYQSDWASKTGTNAWVDGDDGGTPTYSDIVGTQMNGYASGLYAFADTDLIDVAMLSAPGYCEKEVLAAIQSIVTNRQDCLGAVHTPIDLNCQQAINWHNASGGDYATTSVKLTSNCLAMYWPWVEIYDPYNKINIWVPPVGFALQRMAYTDNVAEPWYAPAGINRGQCLEALRVQYNATLGQREAMYGPGNGNCINPIVNLPLDGITIYGQRTMQRTASSLDRINVRRLIFYMAKVISRSVRTLVFEQNDEQLWNQFRQIVSPFVQDIKARRGVEEFKVVCDKSVNIAYRRNNNEMYGYILLIPTKTAEKIIVNFTLNPSGATLSAPQIG